jgi:D-amino-acid dehydrogenase
VHGLKPGLFGGVHFAQDAHVDPRALVATLARLAKQHGAEILERRRVVGLDGEGGVLTEEGPVRADEVVVATGAQSRALLRRSGVHVPVEAARGVSLQFPSNAVSQVPVMLHEEHTTLTPMGDEIRATAKLELGEWDRQVKPRVAQSVLDSVDRFLDVGLLGKPAEVWGGLRPLTPDGMPILGRHPALPKTVLATGHGRLGVGLSLWTGELVASGKPVPALARADRFG